MTDKTSTDASANKTPPTKEQLALRRLGERIANAIRARTSVGALTAGLRRGFHPQLLLAWIIVTMLPALIAALPVGTWLFAQFGHSPRAGAIASGHDPALVADALDRLDAEGALLAGSGAFALFLAIALSPWLAGMIVAQIRTVYRLRMGGVLRAGLGEYPRMLRMLLFSLAPMTLALAIGLLALWFTQSQADEAVLASRAADAARPALVLLGVLLVLVHITVEAARGWLGADLALTSVVEAWRRGVALLWNKPAATLTVYFGTSAVGYGLALLIGRLRMLIDTSGWVGWIMAFVLTQLVIAALAWGRSARLHGLADVATGTILAQPAVSDSEAKEQLKEATQRQAEPALS